MDSPSTVRPNRSDTPARSKTARAPIVRCAVICANLGMALTLAICGSGCQLSNYRAACAQSMQNSRQLSRRGSGAMDQHDWAGAETLFAQAVKACPTDYEARRNYAETLWHRGSREDAIVQMAEAAKSAPEDVELRVRLAEFRLAVGDVTGARADADAALEIDPHSANAWTAHALILRQMGDNRQALADLHQALSYEPRSPRVLHELAVTYLALNEPQRALANLQSILDQHPPGDEPQELLFEVGQAYLALGRYDDATGSFRHALVRDKPQPQILFSLSEAEMRRGRPVEARWALEQAIALDPANPQYRRILAQFPHAPVVR